MTRPRTGSLRGPRPDVPYLEIWRLTGLRRPYFRVYLFDVSDRQPRLVPAFYRFMWSARLLGPRWCRRMLGQRATGVMRAPYQVGTFVERIKL